MRKIKKLCKECNRNKIEIAYWDIELECYLYLKDLPICNCCSLGLDKAFLQKQRRELESKIKNKFVGRSK